MNHGKIRLTPVQIVALGFVALILMGTLLLMCPVSSSSDAPTPFIDALFTATSAACVTGLAVVDTAAYWSTFGKAVILCLIQIGGLGAMTIITSVLVFIRKRITLQDSRLLMQSAGTMQLGGLKVILKRIFIGTLMFEFAGAVLLAIRFIPIFGFAEGCLKAIFHSVSAFCNAGFDTLGDYAGGASLSAFSGDALVSFTVMGLIIMGGLGFAVWDDVLSCRFKFKKLSFHSKMTLSVTLFLILSGAVLFFIFEYSAAFAAFPLPEKLLNSLFQSVTPRTAGFATVPMASLSDAGAVLTLFLMLVGGGSGSTAGGMKVTTLAVIVMSTVSSARKSNQPGAFGRSIDDQTVRQASSVAFIYVFIAVFATMLLCAVEPHGLKDTAFEVVSAIGTVGLSTGITPTLGTGAKAILSLLMYAGRIGGLSLALVLSEKRSKVPVTHPAGKILIG